MKHKYKTIYKTKYKINKIYFKIIKMNKKAHKIWINKVKVIRNNKKITMIRKIVNFIQNKIMSKKEKRTIDMRIHL